MAVHRDEFLPLRDDRFEDAGGRWGIVGGRRRGRPWVSRAVLGVFSSEAGEVGEFDHTSSGTLSGATGAKGPRARGFNVLCVNCPAPIGVDLPLHGSRMSSGVPGGTEVRVRSRRSTAHADLSPSWERMGAVRSKVSDSVPAAWVTLSGLPETQ